MKVKVNDEIKYDKEDSNFSWIGKVIRVYPQSVDVFYHGLVERVKKKDIIKVI